MRKINVLLLGVLVAFVGFLGSCKDDTNDAGPTVTVKNGTTTVNDGDTIKGAEGDAITLNVDFEMGDKKLVSVKIISYYGTKTLTVLDTALNSGLFNGADESFSFSYPTTVSSVTEKVVFSTTDKNDKVGASTVVIKPKSTVPTGSVKTTTAVMMGSYLNNSYGSIYSVGLGKVLTLRAGFSSQSDADVFYYYQLVTGASNNELASLAAPTYSMVSTLFGNATYGVPKWTTKNTTKFKLNPISSSAFDAIGTNGATAFNSATTGFDSGTDVYSALTKLTAGDVIAVNTAAGKKALIKITQIVTGTSGYAVLTIKTLVP